MPPRNKIDAWFHAPLWRFAVITVVAWAMLGLYLLINHNQPAAVTTVEMPSWVPFCPAFFPPYVGLLLLTWLLPVALRNRDQFRACLRAYAWAWLLVVPWWVLTPTMLSRPPLPDGVWAHAFRWIWKVDQPFNVTPCAHAVGPMIAVWFASREYPAWRWPLAAVLLFTLPSIALVWQHRPVDILLGLVAAAIGIVIAESVRRKKVARQFLCGAGVSERSGGRFAETSRTPSPRAGKATRRSPRSHQIFTIIKRKDEAAGASSSGGVNNSRGSSKA